MGWLISNGRDDQPIYGPFERLTLVTTITPRPVEPGQRSGNRAKACTSMLEVGQRLREVHHIPISDSQVWRICRSQALKPCQVRSWTKSHDPPFDTKAVDVCSLYLDPQENWAVFSVDEKTGIQAKSHVNPTRPARPAQSISLSSSRTLTAKCQRISNCTASSTTCPLTTPQASKRSLMPTPEHSCTGHQHTRRG